MIVKLLKMLGIAFAFVAILLVAVVLLLNTDKVQQWLLQRAVAILREELKTDVSVGHASISLRGGRLTLSDVTVDDRQGRKMLSMEQLAVGIDLCALRRREVVITEAQVSGLKTMFCRPASPTDSAVNYQFLVDVLKRHKESGTTVDADTTTGKRRPVTFRIKTATVHIDSLCYTTDNGRPRRNTGRPHHGAFDAGHLDLFATMKLTIELPGDSQPFHVTLTDCRAVDHGSGLQVDSLQLQANVGSDSLLLSDVTLRLPHTRLSFAKGRVAYARHTPLSYDVPLLTATTQLRDIATPFAPVLQNFTTPLQLQCAFSGGADTMCFDRVSVTTAGQHPELQISAVGRITHLRAKEQLHVHFDVSKMSTRSGMPERIIGHFPVKKYMMKQLHALGNISYSGHFDVLYKKEAFAGQLGTEQGSVNFSFDIDERDKYLSGTADTDSLELGRVMDMKQLGTIACRADFRFDISKPRTAKMRQQKGGKLPIGNIEAEVSEGHYKFVTVHNVAATIQSDGAVATGKVVDRGKHIDITCSFTFTDTDQMQKLKIKPGIKFHKKKSEKNND